MLFGQVRVGAAGGLHEALELLDNHAPACWARGRSRDLAAVDWAALRQLYGYLVDRRCIVQLTDINHAYLDIHSHEVLSKIGRDTNEWEAMVPPNVAAAIKQRRLFGYR